MSNLTSNKKPFRNISFGTKFLSTFLLIVIVVVGRILKQRSIYWWQLRKHAHSLFILDAILMLLYACVAHYSVIVLVLLWVVQFPRQANYICLIASLISFSPLCSPRFPSKPDFLDAHLKVPNTMNCLNF